MIEPQVADQYNICNQNSFDCYYQDAYYQVIIRIDIYVEIVTIMINILKRLKIHFCTSFIFIIRSPLYMYNVNTQSN